MFCILALYFPSRSYGFFFSLQPPPSKAELSRKEQSSAVGAMEAGDPTATVIQLCKNVWTQVLLLKGSVSKSVYVAKMTS